MLVNCCVEHTLKIIYILKRRQYFQKTTRTTTTIERIMICYSKRRQLALAHTHTHTEHKNVMYVCTCVNEFVYLRRSPMQNDRPSKYAASQYMCIDSHYPHCCMYLEKEMIDIRVHYIFNQSAYNCSLVRSYRDMCANVYTQTDFDDIIYYWQIRKYVVEPLQYTRITFACTDNAYDSLGVQ